MFLEDKNYNSVNTIKSTLLLASVFVTGFAVLIVEIIAIRILSPYYGNTIYTTSSVIGIILAALSLGYYLGGVLSDKYPKFSLFYSIIFVSGFLVIIINIL
jgi:predicted membrane-bound spermidine synthase